MYYFGAILDFLYSPFWTFLYSSVCIQTLRFWVKCDNLPQSFIYKLKPMETWSSLPCVTSIYICIVVVFYYSKQMLPHVPKGRFTSGYTSLKYSLPTRTHTHTQVSAFAAVTRHTDINYHCWSDSWEQGSPAFSFTEERYKQIHIWYDNLEKKLKLWS